MLISVHNRLLRHRRKVLWGLAVLAAVSVAPTVKTALMSAHGHGDLSDAVPICVVVGACVAIVGVVVFSLRRVIERPLWLIPAPLAWAMVFVPVASGYLGRAGPPGSQVLRL